MEVAGESDLSKITLLIQGQERAEPKPSKSCSMAIYHLWLNKFQPLPEKKAHILLVEINM